MGNGEVNAEGWGGVEMRGGGVGGVGGGCHKQFML